MNSPAINFSQMFYNCVSLKNFSIITKDKQKSKNKIIKEQKDNPIESLNLNNSKEINRQSYTELYFFNKLNKNPEKIYENNNKFYFSDSKTKSQNSFYFSNINDISEDKKKQISKLFFRVIIFHFHFHHLTHHYFNIILMIIN